MSALGRFWAGFKNGIRTQRQLDAEKPRPRRGWRESVELLALVGAMAAARYADKIGGWPYLLSWVAVAAVVIAVLWLLWRLLRPQVIFLRDEGIVGCWRWAREKVFTPILYGRKRK